MTTMVATVSPRELALRGRGTRRYQLPMHDDSNDGPKLCECGCGQPTPIATYTSRKYGIAKGRPTRFISGHNSRGREATASMRAKLAAAHHPSGALSPNWKGGTHRQRGRLKIYVGHEHPMADRGGYVFEHRLVAARKLGRMLLRAEHVHHVDLDDQNNAPENLVVVSNSEHRRIHWLIRRGAQPTDAVRQVLG